jgi:hypothetical protein
MRPADARNARNSALLTELLGMEVRHGRLAYRMLARRLHPDDPTPEAKAMWETTGAMCAIDLMKIEFPPDNTPEARELKSDFGAGRRRWRSA